MGYYTDYTLSVYGMKRGTNGSIEMTSQIPAALENQIEAEIEKMDVFTDGNIGDSFYGNCKWYDHEEDMRLLSTRFPENVFWLSGHGEAEDDLWQKFFVNGKMQTCHAKIVYDDFDASKLDSGGLTGIGDRKYSYQRE